MLRRTLALLATAVAATGALLAPASVASASPVNPGGFCDKAELGQIRPADNGRWYLCAPGSNNTRHWTATTSPAPGDTGCGYRCPTPTATPTGGPTATPTGPHPGSAGSSPSHASTGSGQRSTTSPAPMTTLPRTDSIRPPWAPLGIGASLLLLGIAILLVRRRDRHARVRG